LLACISILLQRTRAKIIVPQLFAIGLIEKESTVKIENLRELICGLAHL